MLILNRCKLLQVDSFGWLFNGTFNGAMGLFQQDKIDLLGHATIMRIERLKYVEFTGDIFRVEYGIYSQSYRSA